MVSLRAIAKRLPPGGAEWPYSLEICDPAGVRPSSTKLGRALKPVHFNFNPFSASPVFGQVQKFFWKIYCYLCFNAGEIYQETLFLEKTLNFFSYRSEKTGKSSQN